MNISFTLDQSRIVNQQSILPPPLYIYLSCPSFPSSTLYLSCPSLPSSTLSISCPSFPPLYTLNLMSFLPPPLYTQSLMSFLPLLYTLSLMFLL